MRTNPFSDVLDFLSDGEWTTYAFWSLVIASIVIATVNFVRNPNQRSGLHVWNWLVRFFLGAMWWEQSLWKLPPDYSGLRYWMQEMGKWACTSLQRHFVTDIVLPHFYFFAPQVYMAEVLIAVMLILGIFTRLGGLVGAMMAINLWLGLYRSAGEWPWTYFFLMIVQIMFLIYPPGRSLGLDALLLKQHEKSSEGGLSARFVRLLSWAS